MPRPHQILPSRLPRPDQIPRSLLRRGRYPHRHDLIQPQQPSQMHRVSRVGLHPIASRALQLRRRGHLATQTSTRQRPSQPITGRPSLIHHRARTRQPGDPPQHIDVRRRQPRLQLLPGLPIDRGRGHRPGMHIQPNTRTLTKHRGLLTHVGKAKHGNALGNPRDCVSEVPASNHYKQVVTTYGLID